MIAAGNVALLSLLPFGYLWFRHRTDTRARPNHD